MRCPNCGNENPPDYMFCDECGARLSGEDQATPVTDTDAAAETVGMPVAAAVSDTGIRSLPSTPSYSSTGGSGSGAGVDDMGMGGSGMGLGSNGDMPSIDAGGTDRSYDDMQNDTSAQADTSAGASTPTPMTEDTVSAAAPSYSYDAMSSGQPTTEGDTGAQAAPMPDVSPISSTMDEPGTVEPSPYASEYQDYSASAMTVDTADASATAEAAVNMGSMDAEDTTGATDAVVGGGATAWATDALHHLEGAQQALASGDWSSFGQAMTTLKSALETAVSAGGASAVQPMLPSMGSAVATPQPSAPQASEDTSVYTPSPVSTAPPATYESTPAASSSAADTGIDTAAAPVDWASSTVSDNGSYDYGSSSGQGIAVEPAGDAGTFAPVQQEAQPAETTDTSMAGGTMAPPVQAGSGGLSEGMGAGVARLVVISTGAEMSLPEQEEITVGREDPSSGIFPDVDLTPYGGEDGGVSRRHARLLHIGDDYFVEDLQSTNYTKLDGQRLPAHVRERLEDGARLDFGRVALIFRRS
ncbi:MAG: FHA domain-containing protein [Chloroflexota bacterium]